MPDTSTLPRWDATALFPSLQSRQLAAAHEAARAPTWPGWSRSTTATASTRPSRTSRRPRRWRPSRRCSPRPTPSPPTAPAPGLRAQLRDAPTAATTPARPSSPSSIATTRRCASCRPASRRGWRPWDRRPWPPPARSAPTTPTSSIGPAPAPSTRWARTRSRCTPSSRVTGSGAWARLHSDVTSQLLATIVRPDGTTEPLPMTAVRGLATDPDAERAPGGLRRRAGGLADGGRAPRRGAERHQGRGQRR